MNVSLYLHIQSWRLCMKYLKISLKRPWPTSPLNCRLSVCLIYPSVHLSCLPVLSVLSMYVCLSGLPVCLVCLVSLSVLSVLPERIIQGLYSKQTDTLAGTDFSNECSIWNVTSLYKDSSWPFIMMISTHKCVRNILMHSSDLISLQFIEGSLGII